MDRQMVREWLLQWGLPREREETSRDYGEPRPRIDASMGPPSGEGGNARYAVDQPFPVVGFNGASLGRGRKHTFIIHEDVNQLYASMGPPSGEGGNG